MEIRIAIFFIFLMLGCRVQHDQPTYGQDIKVNTLPKDTFYNLNFTDLDKYVIEWGSPNFKNVTSDTFNVLGSGNLELSEANKNYLVLNQPCGSGCALYVLLPLLPYKKELVFWNVVYHNLDNEIIITTLDPGIAKFAIFQFGIAQKKEIIIDDMCPAADKSMCIDSIFLEKDKIFFQYQGKNWNPDEPDNRVKVILIN